jgi:hypothetical protein
MYMYSMFVYGIYMYCTDLILVTATSFLAEGLGQEGGGYHQRDLEGKPSQSAKSPGSN